MAPKQSQNADEILKSFLSVSSRSVLLFVKTENEQLELLCISFFFLVTHAERDGVIHLHSMTRRLDIHLTVRKTVQSLKFVDRDLNQRNVSLCVTTLSLKQYWTDVLM
jgi:hypothetical protein